MKNFFCGILVLVVLASLAQASEPISLREPQERDYQYHVSCRVEVNGALTLPPTKEQPRPSQLTIQGASSIEYDERILAAAGGKVQKTIRHYQRLEFQRQVGKQNQHQVLRPQLSRLVLLRHQQLEVPFSPAGPLTWGEIELVRTDVFTPALAGLLPTTPVRAADTWQASSEAVLELTDLERIEQGGLTCRLESIQVLNNRRHARVAFSGSVRGLGEDGPCQHQLEGYFYFDLTSQHLGYLSLKGTQLLLDKSGAAAGKIEGTFVLTRQPLRQCPTLTDEALRGLVLEPNEDNTLLLYDSQELGVRFLYPRRWRVAGANGRQIGLDEKRGSGLLLTLEPLGKVPSSAQFLQEVKNWLGQQKGRVIRIDTPRQLQGAPRWLEHFVVEAEVGRQHVSLQYFVVRQTQGGGTLTARLLPADLASLQRDAARIARSIEITRKLE